MLLKKTTIDASICEMFLSKFSEVMLLPRSKYEGNHAYFNFQGWAKCLGYA